MNLGRHHSFTYEFPIQTRILKMAVQADVANIAKVHPTSQVRSKLE